MFPSLFFSCDYPLGILERRQHGQKTRYKNQVMIAVQLFVSITTKGSSKEGLEDTVNGATTKGHLERSLFLLL